MDIISNYKHLVKVAATPSDNVVNSECVYAFENPYATSSTSSKSNTNGVVINMNAFIGTIQEKALNDNEGGGTFLRIVKTRTLKKESDTDKKPDDNAKMEVTKLGIGIEGGFKSIDYKHDANATHSIVMLKHNNYDDKKQKGCVQ